VNACELHIANGGNWRTTSIRDLWDDLLERARFLPQENSASAAQVLNRGWVESKRWE